MGSSKLAELSLCLASLRSALWSASSVDDLFLLFRCQKATFRWICCTQVEAMLSHFSVFATASNNGSAKFSKKPF